MMTRLERIQMMHDNFRKVQSDLRSFGATDTEPDYIYEDNIRRAVNGKPFIMDFGSDNPWQLYYIFKGYKRANKTLTAACKRVVRAIEGALIKDIPDIREWAKATLWRVDIDFCP